MADVVVTVPKAKWEAWIAEGDLPGQPWSGLYSLFTIGTRRPNIRPGERVYVVAHGRLRGYAPLFEPRYDRREVSAGDHRSAYRTMVLWSLVRRGDPVAVTIPGQIRGFQGWRYRWWDREAEVPFQDWRIP